MNDENIQISEDDMVAGIKAVLNMADAYSDGISILGNGAVGPIGLDDPDVVEMADVAFENTSSSPMQAWLSYRDLIWECLAESQDVVNEAAKLLSEHAEGMFDLDSKNAAIIEDAGSFDVAKHPQREG